MIEKSRLITIAEEYLKDSPDYLVDISIGAGNAIIIEIDNDSGVDINQCIELSRYIESKLNRDEDDFELTVTSFGLTTPFKTLRQYQKYEGSEVELLSNKGEKLTGLLKSSDETGFVVTVSNKIKPEGAKRKVVLDEDIYFAFDDVKYTKYLIKI